MPAVPAADEPGRLEVLRARLVAPMPDDRPWGWLGPLLVTAFGTFLRFNRLQVPRALIFDETYYAKDAWSILHHGVELNLVEQRQRASSRPGTRTSSRRATGPRPAGSTWCSRRWASC